MLNLKLGIIELYKKVATSLPPDVEEAIKAAHAHESEGTEAKGQLGSTLLTIKHSRQQKQPLCLDSGVPVFYVSVPTGMKHSDIKSAIMEATREATKLIPLASNSVDPITGENTSDNTGAGFPVIHIEESSGTNLSVELMMLGSSSENLGRTYQLPDAALGADRGLDGVYKCVMDAVRQAGGRGCPPYIIGVGLGTTRDQVTRLSKEQLRRKIGDTNPLNELKALEQKLYADINKLGIGGATTTLGVKIGAYHRHPDSYFVDVSLLCWNTRRGKLIW